ncbi:MAG: cytidine deaminase [Flavobacteriales bacterium]|nr:cytidine deaminase [Flavobacteriales bacterium]
MSSQEPFTFSFQRHAGWQDLCAADQELLIQAREAAGRAYAEYSDFHVGAALRMSDGALFTGNNQENASYPAGICAERTALHAAMSQHPKGTVDVMAVVVIDIKSDVPVSPCGICRQALLEQEGRQDKRPLRLLLGVENGAVYEIATASNLLPLYFNRSFLKR